PIAHFCDAGIPIVISTDNPARMGTTIGHEYALAASLGLSHDDLRSATETAIRASFSSEERRAQLLAASIGPPRPEYGPRAHSERGTRYSAPRAAAAAAPRSDVTV